MNASSQERPRALITGAAKRIGARIAEHLARRGCDIVLHCHLSMHEAEALSNHLQTLGARVTIMRQDLAKPHDLANFFNGVPPCDIIVHNASVFIRDDITSMDSEVLEAQMRVNVMAPLLLSQGFAKQLPTNRAGNVIFLSDGVFGWSVSPHFFSYAASKLALTASTDLLASALAPNIRVNTLALGATLESPQDPTGMFARLAELSPLGHTSTPDDVVRTIDYILDTPSITGQIFSLAAGMQLATRRFAEKRTA